MDYDEFWNIRDEAGVPPERKYDTGRGRKAYGICFGLWCAWMAYLAIWLASCFVNLPYEEFTELITNCGGYPWAACYITGSFELFGFGAWAFFGSGLLKIACAVISRATGSVPLAYDPPKMAGFLWTGIFAVMTLFILGCSAMTVGALGGLLGDSSGAGPLLFMLTGPVAVIGGVVAAIAGFVITVLSIPMFRFTWKWAGAALNGARGRFA